MSAPLVSIVVPVYNAAEFVERTLKSLFAQVHTPLEIVAVDDGSTDNGLSVLKKYADKIKIIEQENGGQARAINRGWEECRGSYIGYLSADDLLDPGAIDRIVRFLESDSTCVAAYPDYRLIDGNDRWLRNVKTPSFQLQSVVGHLQCPPGPGLIFRRQSLDLIGPWSPEFRQMPDYEFLLRLALAGKVARVPEVLAGFRVHEGSQTFAPSSAARSEEPVTIMTRYFSRPDLPSLFFNWRYQAFSYAHLLSARLHLRSGRWGVGVKHLMRAMSFRPRVILERQAQSLVLNALFGRIYYRLRHGVR